jgi:hypothetical protein
MKGRWEKPLGTLAAVTGPEGKNGERGPRKGDKGKRKKDPTLEDSRTRHVPIK